MRSMAFESALPVSAEAGMAGHISRTQALVLVHIILTAIAAGVGVVFPVVQLDSDWLIYPSCLLVTGSFIWILWSWYAVRKSLFDPYALFMIAAWLFNGGQALLEVFGMNSGGILVNEVRSDTLVKALYLTTVSGLCFHTGALVSLSRKSRSTRTEPSGPEREKASRWAGWMLLGIAFVPALKLLRGSFDLVLDYGYMGLYRRHPATPVSYALALFLVPAVIFLVAGSRQSRGTQLFCLALMALYAGSSLFLGQRGAATMSCVAIAWVFEKCIRRIPRPLIALFALLALVIFPMIRGTRITGARYRMSWESQWELLSSIGNPFSAAIAEMGHSLVTVTDTLTLVPESRPFDLGTSYFYAASTIVPNLGWELHPSVTHGLLCDWLTATVDPVTFNSGGGLGFSFIAESYMNFGWYGGPLWLGLVGFWITSFFLSADRADPARQALVASFLSFFLVFARGESAIVIRGLAWYALIPYLLVIALTKRRRAQKALR